MVEVRVTVAGDGFHAAAQRQPKRRTTRHHRVDERFLELLEEDFGISEFSLRQAFMGCPRAPKLQAMAVCAWAESKTDDPEERGALIRAWAKKRKVGMYNPRLLEGGEEE